MKKLLILSLLTIVCLSHSFLQQKTDKECEELAPQRYSLCSAQCRECVNENGFTDSQFSECMHNCNYNFYPENCSTYKKVDVCRNSIGTDLANLVRHQFNVDDIGAEFIQRLFDKGDLGTDVYKMFQSGIDIEH